MKPFRVLAVVLALVAIIELYGIIKTNTYQQELNQARVEFFKAAEENQRLKARMTSFFLP